MIQIFIINMIREQVKFILHQSLKIINIWKTLEPLHKNYLKKMKINIVIIQITYRIKYTHNSIKIHKI